MADTPAQEKSVLAIAPGDALPDDGPLGTAARMDAQAGVVLAHAAFDQDIVGLLEAEAVAVVVPHQAILDHRAKAAVEENSSTPAAVQPTILLLVPINDEIGHACSFQVVAADDREDRRGLGLVGDQAIGVERCVEGQGVALASGDAGNGGVESARLAVPNGDPVTQLETLRV